jgi:hypothetical protein
MSILAYRRASPFPTEIVVSLYKYYLFYCTQLYLIFPAHTAIPVMEVPVVIIGGGGCGLNLSIFLSDLGVAHYLFEKHPGTSILPKAHYLNQRTMEIWRSHGMAEVIKSRGRSSSQHESS